MNHHESTVSTGQAAKQLGVHVRTIYRWEEAGRLHPVRLPSGQRRFLQGEIHEILHRRQKTAPRCALYARVSSSKQAEAGNLDRQRQRLEQAARFHGYEITVTITEQASGLNEKRRGLKRLFRLAAEDKIDVVLVEFKDRLARFGFAYILQAMEAYGIRVEVLDGPVAMDASQELVQDMLAMVAVFAARLYGKRAQKFRGQVQKAAKEAEPFG